MNLHKEAACYKASSNEVIWRMKIKVEWKFSQLNLHFPTLRHGGRRRVVGGEEWGYPVAWSDFLIERRWNFKRVACVKPYKRFR